MASCRRRSTPPRRRANGSACSWAAPTPPARREGKRRTMQLVLERRPERSTAIAIASPLIAVALTVITFVILFAIIGKSPAEAIWVYFIEPLTDPFSLQ